MSGLNNNSKLKYDLICDELLGVEISDNGKDYGYICRIDEVIHNRETYYKVITNLGKTFNANLILNALRKSNVTEPKYSGTDFLGIGYPDGTAYSNSVFGPKRKRNPTPILSQAINNNAKVSDSETINITSHVSTGNSFPEENRNIDQILSPEQIHELNWKALVRRSKENIEKSEEVAKENENV